MNTFTQNEKYISMLKIPYEPEKMEGLGLAWAWTCQLKGKKPIGLTKSCIQGSTMGWDEKKYPGLWSNHGQCLTGL